MERCPLCDTPIERYTERKCFENLKTLAKDSSHFHYGTPYYRYGVCQQFHFLKGELIKTIWNPCYRCNFVDIVQKNGEIVSQGSPRNLALEIRKLRAELASLKTFLGIKEKEVKIEK